MSALAVHPLEQLSLAEDPEGDRAASRAAGAGRPALAALGSAGVPAAAPTAPEMGGEPSLDALVSGLWEGLAARQPVACPLCGDELAPVFGAHHHPVGGRCRGCGTTLS